MTPPKLILCAIAYPAIDPSQFRKRVQQAVGERSPEALTATDGQTTTHTSILADLPGTELVTTGIDDLSRGECTVEAMLVAVGAPRLRSIDKWGQSQYAG